MIVHSVYFWWKKDLSDSQKESFVQDLRALEGMDCVHSISIGKPADITRAVVDSSYDIGISVHFKNMAAHDEYQVHETHKTFLANNKELWDKVQIYDIEEF